MKPVLPPCRWDRPCGEPGLRVISVEQPVVEQPLHEPADSRGHRDFRQEYDGAGVGLTVEDRQHPVASREGQPAEQVIDLVASDPAISVVVLGATLGAEGPGPLVSYRSAKGIARLRVPVTVVPGGLSSEQIAAIA